MNKTRVTALLALIITLSACSDVNRSAYNGIQENQRQSCYKLIGHQRDDCLARLNTSYDDYEKARSNKKTPKEN